MPPLRTICSFIGCVILPSFAPLLAMLVVTQLVDPHPAADGRSAANSVPPLGADPPVAKRRIKTQLDPVPPKGIRVYRTRDRKYLAKLKVAVIDSRIIVSAKTAEGVEISLTELPEVTHDPQP